MIIFIFNVYCFGNIYNTKENIISSNNNNEILILYSISFNDVDIEEIPNKDFYYNGIIRIRKEELLKQITILLKHKYPNSNLNIIHMYQYLLSPKLKEKYRNVKVIEVNLNKKITTSFDIAALTLITYFIYPSHVDFDVLTTISDYSYEKLENKCFYELSFSKYIGLFYIFKFYQFKYNDILSFKSENTTEEDSIIIGIGNAIEQE